MGEAKIRAAVRAEADRHTLIATAFDAFAEMVYPGAPLDQMREMRVCFMAGGVGMKALSIRQPWAHLIVHGGKTIENRTWPTRYRGPVLIHAATAFARLTAAMDAARKEVAA